MNTYRDLAVTVTLVRRRLRSKFKELMPADGPAPMDRIALLWLSEAGGTLGQSLLAERLEIDNALMTRMADRLIQQGLVERTASSHDRRVKLLTLTESAGPLIEEGEVTGRRLRELVMHGISEADVRTCLKVLRTVADRLG